MPAIVDHDARRLKLARIACELIAERGIEAATLRAVSDAGGFSTKVVSHYFEDKRHLLLETYRLAARDSSEQAHASQDSGAPDAARYAISLLPTTPAMIRNWKVWFAFWGFAISDDGFSREQAEQIAAADARLAAVIAADAQFGHLDAAARDRLASEVMVTILGVAVRAAFDVERWPAERQQRAVLRRLGLDEPQPRDGHDRMGAPAAAGLAAL